MTKVELQVSGMTCGGCEQSVGKALQRVEGVRAVHADHATGTVVVEAEGQVERELLERAVEDAGYDVVPADRRDLPLIG